MITIAFRLDDPSEISDHTLETNIINMFAKYNSSVTFAVIPFHSKNEKKYPLTKDGVEHLIQAKKAKIIEIAQHGYSHVNANQSPDRINSEFIRVPTDEQKRKIIKGKRHLNEIFQQDTRGFVPPFNTFDEETVKILIKENFSYISAGWEIPKNPNPIIDTIPRTCSLNNARQAIKDAQKFSSLSPIIVIVLHHDDFEEYCNANNSLDHPAFTNLAELESLLRSISNDAMFEIKTLKQIAGNPTDYLQAIRNHRWFTQQHWRLRKYLPETLLLRQSRLRILLQSFGKYRT